MSSVPVSRQSGPFGTNVVDSQALGRAEAQDSRRLVDLFLDGIKRRWARERRRRKVGRAYDMALEISRLIPQGAEVLDVGCGNGFIAHHLSALLGAGVIGIDLGDSAEAPIDFRRYYGARFPVPDDSVDAVLLCYVLHHAQNVRVVLDEVRRVLRAGGVAIIYEDIPQGPLDRFVCWFHNLQWRNRTGPCTFRNESRWRLLFESSGLEVLTERPLSRWRNLTHPVTRRLYLLTAIHSEVNAAGHLHTRRSTLPDVPVRWRSNCMNRE